MDHGVPRVLCRARTKPFALVAPASNSTYGVATAASHFLAKGGDSSCSTILVWSPELRAQARSPWTGEFQQLCRFTPLNKAVTVPFPSTLGFWAGGR